MATSKEAGAILSRATAETLGYRNKVLPEGSCIPDNDQDHCESAQRLPALFEASEKSLPLPVPPVPQVPDENQSCSMRTQCGPDLADLRAATGSRTIRFADLRVATGARTIAGHRAAAGSRVILFAGLRAATGSICRPSGCCRFLDHPPVIWLYRFDFHYSSRVRV